MNKTFRGKWAAFVAAVMGAWISLSASAAWAADSDLDTAIDAGFGKVVKYGRWTAAMVLAIVFVLAWAERGQNPDNPHEANRAGRKMIWAGVGFLVVIGYKLVLTGLVNWFNIDPHSIPDFLWQ